MTGSELTMGVLASWVWDNWALLAMVGTLASLLVFVIWLIGKYVRICLNIFTDSPPPPVRGTKRVDYPLLHGEVVRFRSFDGTSLRGMRLKARTPGEPKGTIIYCHEFGSDMYSVGRYARWLLEAGFDLFTFDFRGHGESSNPTRYRPLQWPSDKDMEDVLGACAYVESVLAAEGRPTDVGIFGISRGAAAGLLAAASDPNVKAIACDGAFSTDTTCVMFMRRWAHIFARVRLVYENHPPQFWLLLWKVMVLFAQPRHGCRYPSVSRALSDMQPRPILFIHGRRDSYIQMDQTQMLYDAAPEPKYLWLVDRAKHNESVVVARDEYAARTVAFFRKHLAGEAVEEAEITAPKETDAA